MKIMGPDAAFQGVQSLQKSRLDSLKDTMSRVSSQAAESEDASKAKEAELEKAATDFEALLLGQMLKSMWQSVESSGLLSGSREESMYRDMMNDEMAKSISEGQGIGIKEVIIRDLKKFA